MNPTDEMKPKEELQNIIDRIAAADSPVGMDAVYVHALILDKLCAIEKRLAQLEGPAPATKTDGDRLR